MMKDHNHSDAKSGDGMSGRGGSNVGKMEGKPAAGIGDMREVMRNQLMNVKLYEHQGSADNLLGANRRSTLVKKGEKTTLQDLEQNYKMAHISKAGMSPAPQRNKLDIGLASPKRAEPPKGLMNRTTSNDNFVKRLGSP